MFCNYFLKIYGLPFHFLNSDFQRGKVFIFDKVSFNIFMPHALPYLKSHKIFFYFFSQKF